MPEQKQNIITVEVEDYYHVGSFHRNIPRKNWYRFEKRIEQNTMRALALLDEFNIKATFFVLGWVADALPEVIREISDRGHDIASKGYHHQPVRHLSPGELREELAQGREALEAATGREVLGYRVAHGWLRPSDLWVLDVLAEEGYHYDSSIGLMFRRFASEKWRRWVHKHRCGEKEIWEFPLSSWNLGGLFFPIAGGNYYRQFPHTFLKVAVDKWHRKYDAPFVMYFHIWELDPTQPRINSGSVLTNIRHYRNLDKMSWVLRDYFRKYPFTSIAHYLGYAPESVRQRQAVTRASMAVPSHLPPMFKTTAAAQPRTDVSIVIPCFNEESNLRYLANTLESVEQTLSDRYNVQFIFVDDGSADGTSGELKLLYGSKENCQILRHPENQGVAAAILTGIRHATTEIVCSMDCDCTYDPHELSEMIPMLGEDIALVTASPYHPNGTVQNVPAWRLMLSKASSVLYRLVLTQKLWTYTSCFRVYRRSWIMSIRPKHGGFLGVAEILGHLSFRGGKIVEYPATLEVRLLGQSKMKIIKTIVGHLRLLADFTIYRFLGTAPDAAADLGVSESAYGTTQSTTTSLRRNHARAKE